MLAAGRGQLGDPARLLVVPPGLLGHFHAVHEHPQHTRGLRDQLQRVDPAAGRVTAGQPGVPAEGDLYRGSGSEESARATTPADAGSGSGAGADGAAGSGYSSNGTTSATAAAKVPCSGTSSSGAAPSTW